MIKKRCILRKFVQRHCRTSKFDLRTTENPIVALGEYGYEEFVHPSAVDSLSLTIT